MRKPDKARIRVAEPGGRIRTWYVTRKQWQRPFPKVDQRFHAVKKIGKLEPSRRYEVWFERWVEHGGKRFWQELRDARFETLPLRLPKVGSPPFTVALGSCFYDHRDGGQAAEAYKHLYDRGSPSVRPHLTFLTGDLVYLDIGFDSLSPNTKELRERIADDYAKHWRSLGSIFTRGGTWILPDDHEYWNDYPFYDSWLIPPLWMLKEKNVRAAWKETARGAVRNVERSPVVETFSVGRDLSFCLADPRTYRGVHKGRAVMMHPKSFSKLLDWARGLRSPGVLVIPQPLIVNKNDDERNLLSFPDQYAELLSALGHTGHDIVVLSGDVHFGRIAGCPLGPKGGRLLEVISSPLSNLTGLNGISTAKARFSPKQFPHPSTTPPGWERMRVVYDKNLAVQTLPHGDVYPKRRTKEHFMTASFSRSNDGRVRFSVQAWHVRERRGAKQLPSKGFKRAFVTKLR